MSLLPILGVDWSGLGDWRWILSHRTMNFFLATGGLTGPSRPTCPPTGDGGQQREILFRES